MFSQFQDIYDQLLPEPAPSVTPENQPIIDEFRNRPDIADHLKPEHNDDFLARWLIARNWNLDAAAEMFVNSMIWREENDIDRIMEWFPQTENYQKVIDYWPSSRARGQLTIEGLPVYYERVGVVDAKELLNHVTEEDLTNFHIYEQECREELRREMYEKFGFTVGTVFIQDLQGLGMKNLYRPGLNLVGKLSEIDKANYPETVRKMFLINAPTVFPLVWNIVKNFFDPEVIKKFSVHDNNGYDIFSRILPIDEIPTFAGGTKEGVALGGRGYNWLNTKTITVSRSSSYIEEIEVTQDGVLSWFCYTDSGDVGFFIERDGEKIENAGRVRKSEGSISVESGIYSIVFDNSYSWTKSKTIYYKFETLNGEIEEEKLV